MAREEEIRKERLRKLKELERLGINPYPYKYEQKNLASEIHQKYKSIKPEEKSKERVKVAGRLLSIRRHGKINFAHLQDRSGKIQVIFEESTLGKEKLKFFQNFIDAGDIVGCEGIVMRTKKGELSVLVKNFILLSKSIRALPEKWHGLKDPELRYRHRCLDLIMNPNVRDIFKKKALILKTIRNFLDERGFIEVDTPALQLVYGGAAAKPFKTFLNALKQEMFLRISDELYLKRLIVGGLGKVYEICKDFRNESIDRLHHPEFLQVELYEAYSDYNDMMKLFESLMKTLAKTLYGTTKITYQGNKIDFGKWKHLTVIDAIKKYANINVNVSREELVPLIDKHNLEIPKTASWGTIVNELFESLVADKIMEPTLILDYPLESTPLCKPHRKDKRLVERFEGVCCGIEVCNAYSELNDPILQRKLLEEQVKKRKQLKEVWAESIDEDFLFALEHGMPPLGGLGIGIDRITMILTDQPSIREVIPFPLKRPKAREKKLKS